MKSGWFKDTIVLKLASSLSVTNKGKGSFAPLTWAAAGRRRSFADAEFLNNVFVALGVVGLKVIEQATPLAYHHEKTAPGSVILLMGLEVLRQLANALAEDCYLHLRTSSIGGVRAVLADNALLMFSR
jgi:hypothetical protein